MSSVNIVMQRGNLTRDPEVKYSTKGIPIVHFSIAVSRKYRKQDGELKEEVSFFDVEAFGTQAKSCGDYLIKGSDVLVEGRLRQDRWENQEGQRRNKVLIRADRVHFLGRTRLNEERKSEYNAPSDDNMEERAPVF